MMPGQVRPPIPVRASSSHSTQQHKHTTTHTHTNSWVIYFNTEGAKVLCTTSPFKAVCPFFEHVRLRDANAWVMNLLHSQPVAGDGDMDTATAGEHQVFDFLGLVG